MEDKQLVEHESKSIADLSLSDVQFKFDREKSYDEQAEEVVNAMATAKAVEDQKVAEKLTENKAKELELKSEAKAKQAEKATLDAEMSKQEAERQLYEGVLQTFGITKHLPKWLMRIMVAVLSPVYVALTIAIGVPFGIVKTVIDNADNVLCRYEQADEKVKPRLKTTVWLLLIVSALVAVGIVMLRIFVKN